MHAEVKVAILCGLLLSPGAAAAGAAPDPWSQAPPLPTACYSSQDPKPGLGEIIGSLEQQRQRQEEINQRSSDALKALDISEQQSRMIAFLSSNPEKAMKYMQAQADSVAIPEAIGSLSEERARMTAELESLEARYKAAIDARVGPLLEEHSKLPSGKGVTAADQVRGQALIRRGNAAYEGLCAEWFSAAGPFHEWLGRFRDHITKEWIPRNEELHASRKLNFEVMGIPAAEYRSTAALEGVVEFLRKADDVLRHRWLEPWHAY